MKNEGLLVGKTIEIVYKDENGDEDAIVLVFTDGTKAFICTNASNFMYTVFIDTEPPIKR